MRLRFVMAVCLLGCSSETPSNDAGTDASVDVVNDTAPDGPAKDAATACNALTNIGTVVQQMFVATDAVTGDGGVIAAGTYVLTAAAIYTGADGGSGPTGTTFQGTAAVPDGGTYERVASALDDAGSDGSAFRENGTLVVNGPNIKITPTCPASGPLPYSTYDSNGTTLHFYAPAAGIGNPPLMVEYTKQ